MQNELNPLVEVLTNGFSSDDQLAKGLAAYTTVLGYPTGLGISGTIDGLNVTLTMNIAVTSADGQLNVVK